MKPNLYCCTSESSLDLAEDMARSASGDFNPILLLGPNYTKWTEKLHLIVASMMVQRALGYGYMMYADSDCLFLQPSADDLLSRLGTLDAVFQCNGTGGIGTGLFVTRTDEWMVSWWKGLEALMEGVGPSCQNEELAANRNLDRIRHAVLPPEQYWTPCVVLKDHGVREWQLEGFPPQARFVHLSCIYPEAKRSVMSQIKNSL